VHVTRLDGGQFRRRKGLTIHERGSSGPTDDGALSLAAAIVGTARLNGRMAGLIAADAALHRHLVTREELSVAAAHLAGPASVIARRVVERADACAESPGETRLREALWLMGIQATAQAPVDDGAFHAVVDFLVEEHRVVIEFDGFVKYGRRSPFTLESTPAEVVVAEKVREDHIRSLGYVVVRVTWLDLENLPQLRRRIEAALALARSASGGRTSGPPR
jgi:very-short-patch-repair endonuclease